MYWEITNYANYFILHKNPEILVDEFSIPNGTHHT